MSKSRNIGHELRLLMSITLMILADLMTPRQNLEGRMISNGLGNILKLLKQERRARKATRRSA